MKPNQILFTAAIFGAVAVILGAFTAHFLKENLDEKHLEIFKVGVSYQFYHVPALLACGILGKLNYNSKFLGYAAICFIVGTLFFSGSLYLLAIRDIAGLSSLAPILGPITPIGGVFFIIGWVFLAISNLNFSNK
jgi:uncharacterized membrane protein YgdD (TMEM256/DUF423 family)